MRPGGAYLSDTYISAVAKTLLEIPIRPSPDTSWLSQVNRALNALEYWASDSDRGLQAPNRRHSIRTYFSAEGIICASGIPFEDAACDTQVSAAWTDLGTGSVELVESVQGLSVQTSYRWRARVLYAPIASDAPGVTPVVRAGPWRRLQGGAGTIDIRIVPEPGLMLGLLTGAGGLVSLSARKRRRPCRVVRSGPVV